MKANHESVHRIGDQDSGDVGGRITDLDATGLLCPLPVLKIRKRIRAIGTGEILRVTADDPASAIDIPHYCAESGNTLIAEDKYGTNLVYLIRKTSPA